MDLTAFDDEEKILFAELAGKYGECMNHQEADKMAYREIETARRNATKREYKPMEPTGDNKPGNLTTGAGSAPQKADFETLQRYIKDGWSLYASRYYTNANGAPVQFYCNEAGNTDTQERAKITDAHRLEQFVNRGIEIFRVIPAEESYIVIDLDRGHSNGVDGVENFLALLKECGAYTGVYSNLDNDSYPCTVHTPSGGLHLYYKADGLDWLERMKNGIADNVELHGGRNRETVNAGGSFKHNGGYTMHGAPADALLFPALLVQLIQRAPRKAPERATDCTTRQKKGYTLEQCIQYGIDNARDAGYTTAHYFVLYAGRRALQAGYGKDEIKQALYSYAETAEHDPADTANTIESL